MTIRRGPGQSCNVLAESKPDIQMSPLSISHYDRCSKRTRSTPHTPNNERQRQWRRSFTNKLSKTLPHPLAIACTKNGMTSMTRTRRLCSDAVKTKRYKQSRMDTFKFRLKQKTIFYCVLPFGLLLRGTWAVVSQGSVLTPHGQLFNSSNCPYTHIRVIL